MSPKRNLMAAVMALVPMLAGLTASPASAEPAMGAGINSGPWRVVNAPQPVEYRDHPHWNYPIPGATFVNDDEFELICYIFGAPAGPNNNRLWYSVYLWPGGLLINDRYLNTPGTAASPQPQGEPCKPAGGGFWGGSGIFYQAVNAPGTVTWGNHPSNAWKAGFGFGTGDSMELDCYMFGEPSGPHGNRLWYFANDHTRHTHGWINDHHLNTPGTAANPQPQGYACMV